MSTVTSAAVAESRRQRLKKKRPLVWIGRILVGLIVSLVAIASAGLIYQAVAQYIDERNFPPPGRLVDIGGYQLHINCTGHGSPTVILDAAGGNSSATWGLVQPELARSTRVCAYDRAGMGWSERGPLPRDLKQHVLELHALLSGAGIEGPYVMVGHSYGGRVALVYAKEYPSDVVGMALIDPGKLDDDPHFPPENRADLATENRTVTVARWLAPFGVVRLLLPHADYADLPVGESAANDAFNVTTKFFRTVGDQYRVLPQTYLQQRGVRDLGSMPLIVMSASTPDDATRRVWTEMNGELTKLSTVGAHRVAQGATHAQLLYKLGYARMTIDAVQEVVDEARDRHR
jgi:pimeloyl-ACP methyl ester carboxylesterase